MSDIDFENMSDEDMMNVTTSPATGGGEAVVEDENQEKETITEEETAVTPSGSEEEENTNEDDENKDESNRPEDDSGILDIPDSEIGRLPPEGQKGADGEPVPQPGAEGGEGVQATPVTEEGDKATPEASSEVTSEAAAGSVDYKQAYEKLTAPFKAGGQTVQVQNLDEAMKLMSFGAHYTQKMQKLAPNLKLLRMLQNNNLLDADKLSHLIEVDKKNPEAIKKVLKDANIDPMDLDANEQTEYKPISHAVSEEEMNFANTIEEITSTATGKATIRDIESNWDQESHKKFFSAPELLKSLAEHRENGIYAQVQTELARLKTLGQIPATMNSYDAYKAVGDHLHNSGRLLVNGIPTNRVNTPVTTSASKPQTEVTQAKSERRIVESRADRPKPVVNNNDKAKAAASPRTTPARARVIQNPLEMSDEEIMKISNFRI